MENTTRPFAVDIIFHYPPELFQLLVDTIPLVCRSKDDILLFFKGAGVSSDSTKDLEKRVKQNRTSITKYEITRVILTRLNEKGEAGLRERREVLKRVVEFEDFSTCWPEDQLKAKGLVSEIRRVVNIKDSFTRMKVEREKERERYTGEYEKRVQEIQDRRRVLEEIKKEFYSLFVEQSEQERGNKLEKILNRLFEINGILLRESFRRIGEKGKGVIEQIDGVIELEGEVYLVEMKWLKDLVGIDDVSRHLVRIYHRNSSRGIFISYTEFTNSALETCKEALQRTVVTLCILQELVSLLEREGDLKDFLKRKIQAAIIDKQPFKAILE
jgi:restriction system protein